MKQMGISEFAKKSFNELSGGQRQRVLLARALLASDDILFLDEPVTGLDFNIVKDLYDMVYVVKRKQRELSHYLLSRKITVIT